MAPYYSKFFQKANSPFFKDLQIFSGYIVSLSGIATLLQKRQILPILAKHHVLGVLLHVFVIRLAGISDGKHNS